MELDLTKNDIEILKSRLFLTELQEKILDLKLEGNCEDVEMKQKYMQVSNTLFELFMTEHNAIGAMFKEQ